MKKLSHYLSEILANRLGLNFENDFLNELFSEIRPNLYLGSRPGIEHTQILKEQGITHIVSCLDRDKQSTVTFLEKDFETLFLPLEDKLTENLASAIDETTDIAFQLSSNNKLLIHCEAGVSRSASIVIALLMYREQKSFYGAFQEVYSARAKILPNIGFASQLQQLEHTLGTTELFDEGVSSLGKYLHEICNAPIDIDSLQSALEKHDYNAWSSIKTIFGDDIPRVIQGVKL